MGKAGCRIQPVFRLHKPLNTSLDRKIAIAVRAD
jgi:hypothetical protein